MADLGDVLGGKPQPEQGLSGWREAFAASARQQEDTERRMVSARLAGLLGPVAWAVYDRFDGKLSMGQASEVALKAMHEVGSESITIVGYVQLTNRACEIAEKILE